MEFRINLDQKLKQLYADQAAKLLADMGQILEPYIPEIVDNFYSELMAIDEIYPILENNLVQKGLKAHLANWIRLVFQPYQEQEVKSVIERQKRIGHIHAKVNVKIEHFIYGIGVLKRNIYGHLNQVILTSNDMASAFMILGQAFDILVSIISQAYVDNEIENEANEVSLKLKGLGQNTAIECERLRSSLLDWLSQTLTLIYQSPAATPLSVTRLEQSSFGLWVIYKADLVFNELNASHFLKEQISAIDEALEAALQARQQQHQVDFFDRMVLLNERVTQTSWFVSSLVDKLLELDTATDPLTRLFNRRYLDTILRRQVDVARSRRLPYAILMIDIDHFKALNDTYGHGAGDQILKQFAELILRSIRESDFAFRYGGEEFLVVLGNATVADTLNIAERIRRDSETRLFQVEDSRISLTCSIGIAADNGHPDYDQVVRLADQALYQAKASGRNRVVVSPTRI